MTEKKQITIILVLNFLLGATSVYFFLLSFDPLQSTDIRYVIRASTFIPITLAYYVIAATREAVELKKKAPDDPHEPPTTPNSDPDISSEPPRQTENWLN